MDVCMEKRNEPLLLRPAGKDYLWGGKRLNDEYGKNIELSPLAETWECSTHPDGVSTVCCGTFDKMELTAVIKAHPELILYADIIRMYFRALKLIKAGILYTASETSASAATVLQVIWTP